MKYIPWYVYFSILIIFPIFSLATPRLEKVSNSNNLIRKQHQQEQEQESFEQRESVGPIDLRSIDDWKLTDLLLISDIDGNLHGVERNSGALLWTLPIDDPLVKISSNITSKTSAGSTLVTSTTTTKSSQNEYIEEENSKSNILWFVEPYQDGSLYYFTPKFGLNKLPTSIKDLVLNSPFSLNGDDKVYTGCRKTSLYTLNIHTGEIVSSFGNDEKCPVPNNHHIKSKGKGMDTIMIGKSVYELSIYSKEDTNVVWNVTYAQWGPNNIDNDLIMQNQQSLDDVYFTPFHDKSLLAINKNLGTPVWISKLPSLAVNVFDVFNNVKEYVILPHPLKVLNDLQINSDDNDQSENSDLCFLNKTLNGEQWFAMSFINYPTLIKSAPISNYQMSLYKLAHKLPIEFNLDFLSSFKVTNSKVVERLVNGIHKTFHLSSKTLYQPVSRFSEMDNVKQITDGKTHHHDDKEIVLGDNDLPIPDVMTGIQFPNSNKNHNKDISTMVNSHNRELLLLDSSKDKELSSYSDLVPSPSIESLSLLKRICEDIIVILVLLVLLMVFGKLGKLTKKFQTLINNSSKPPTPRIPSEKTFDDGKQDLESINYDFPEKPTIHSGTSVEHTSKEDLSEKPIKKVTIVSPNEALERPEEEHKDEPKIETNGVSDNSDLNENDAENDNDDIDDQDEGSTKRKRKRGSRGGKRGGKSKKKVTLDVASSAETDNSLDKEQAEEEVISTKSLLKTVVNSQSIQKLPLKKFQIENNLIISDKILGYGSHGTVVYQGTFENRPVAVKRMLLDFYDIANHEVRLLQESDDHPNVIRYFCSQSSESEKFLYIALELCLCSLEDIIEKSKVYPKKIRLSETNINNTLYQLVSGLHYLHSLKIVHRDIKPQNILVTDSTKRSILNKNQDAGDQISSIRLLISDFGLCKKLDSDQSSFRATTQHAASGTSGWRAPELLLNHDLLEISPDTVSSFGSASKQSNSAGGKRLTKAIDIFSMGCVFFYILSKGSHPFGDRYLREGNIIKGEYDLSILKEYCPSDYVEASHLISSMICYNPSSRLDTPTILKHPFFWGMNKKLEFLLKVSDRFEVERREPPSELLLKLETVANKVHQGNWHRKFDEEFMDQLGKYRKYNPDKVMDLLRALRNKYHHYNDMPLHLQAQMSPLPQGFYKYFNDKFPRLLMEVYFVVEENLKNEHMFTEFY